MLRPPALLRDRRAPAAVLLILLTLLYVPAYLNDPAMPGNETPEGWWGWWDQEHYLASARGFAEGDLSSARHWYPMGYALLGAPFARLLPDHPFFPVNLAALLLTGLAFLGFAGRVGVGAWTAAALFLGSAAADSLLLRCWTVPWNTSPASAALWVLLLLAAGHMAGRRMPLAMGAVAALVGLFRPSDMLPALIILAGVALHEAWLRRALPWRTVAGVAAGGLTVAAAGLVLHLLIHGAGPSPYMEWSGKVGLSFHAFGWKAFALLVAPQPWWGDGQGLMARHPWIGLALVLLPFAVTRGAVLAVLAAAMLAHLAFYTAYVDLLPTGLWRYLNVHYFKWMMPGFALLAWVGLVQVVRWRGGRVLPAVASVAILLVLSVRIMPAQARGEATWRGLQVAGPVPGMAESYFDMSVVHRDAAGELRNVLDMRLWPVPQGVRVLALRRDFVPPVEGLAEGTVALVPRVGLGWPCWLPGRPRACVRLGGG
ncbi:hypothetical protein [Muricoccus aerilatus]|uniref:hypothetical protein n=1 Tax=Muricoccus aerilatus TaxID=452982 RepID=UPI0005C17BC3|nr:hypothetical protein [Roseomonas aerilata]